MAIKCLNCNYVESGAKGLHTFSKCPNCGCTDINKFIRVDDDDKDIDLKKHEKDKKWLESHKAE